jgi:hypothetical protein
MAREGAADPGRDAGGRDPPDALAERGGLMTLCGGHDSVEVVGGVGRSIGAGVGVAVAGVLID